MLVGILVLDEDKSWSLMPTSVRVPDEEHTRSHIPVDVPVFPMKTTHGR